MRGRPTGGSRIPRAPRVRTTRDIDTPIAVYLRSVSGCHSPPTSRGSSSPKNSYTHTHIQYCTTTMTDVNATMGVKVRTANPPVSQTGCCCPNVSHGKFSMSDSGLIRECRPFLPRAGLDHPRNGPTILPSPARPADAPSRALAPSLRPHFAHRRTTTTQCCRSAWPRC